MDLYSVTKNGPFRSYIMKLTLHKWNINPLNSEMKVIDAKNTNY